MVNRTTDQGRGRTGGRISTAPRSTGNVHVGRPRLARLASWNSIEVLPHCGGPTSMHRAVLADTAAPGVT